MYYIYLYYILTRLPGYIIILYFSVYLSQRGYRTWKLASVNSF